MRNATRSHRRARLEWEIGDGTMLEGYKLPVAIMLVQRVLSFAAKARFALRRSRLPKPSLSSVLSSSSSTLLCIMNENTPLPANETDSGVDKVHALLLRAREVNEAAEPVHTYEDVVEITRTWSASVACLDAFTF